MYCSSRFKKYEHKFPFQGLLAVKFKLQILPNLIFKEMIVKNKNRYKKSKKQQVDSISFHNYQNCQRKRYQKEPRLICIKTTLF